MLTPKLELRFADAAIGEENPFPEFKEAEGIVLQGALILGHATERGRTGVTLYFTDEKGRKFYANTSARIIANGLAPAIRGAAVRYGDNLNEA